MVYVDPAYTSQECNQCHHHQTTRHQGFFECPVCGHTLNADLNGARNIAQRYRRMIGWGSCKPAPDLTCNEVKAALRGGIATKYSQKLLL